MCFIKSAGLIILYTLSVFSYNTNRKQSCSFYDNPNLGPLLSSRSCAPFFSDDGPNLKVFFNGRNPEPERKNVLKNFNFGYLNTDEPISSLDDLIRMSSDEIGIPLVEQPKNKPKLWKIDDVKNYAAPEVLPDVGFNVADHEQDEVVKKPQFLDAHEIKLGRTLVDDTQNFDDFVDVDKSLTQEVHDTGRDEINESYLRSPEYYDEGSSVVLSNVIQRREPDFMDELEQIKMNSFQPDELDFKTQLQNIQLENVGAPEIVIDEESVKGDINYEPNFIEEPLIETTTPIPENTTEKTSNAMPTNVTENSIKVSTVDAKVEDNVGSKKNDTELKCTEAHKSETTKEENKLAEKTVLVEEIHTNNKTKENILSDILSIL